MKGVINENIVDMLNLRPLDEVMAEQQDAHPEAVEPEQPATEEQPAVPDHLLGLAEKIASWSGDDHGDAMDDLHKEVLQHARDLMTYGFNIDHPRARGIFEIAASMYGHAITAKNSKRDAQLKAIKLALDKRKVDLDEKRTAHVIGQSVPAGAIDTDNTILVEDRNELLKRLREQNQSK